jgi:hypothetical protein
MLPAIGPSSSGGRLRATSTPVAWSVEPVAEKTSTTTLMLQSSWARVAAR